MKSTFFEEMSPAIEWNELARNICKRNEDNKLTNQEVLDEIDESEEDYDNEEDTSELASDKIKNENAEVIPVNPKEETTKKAVAPTKAPKEKSTAKPKTTTTSTPSVVDSIDENDESESDDDYDYTPEDLDDDEEEDKEDESIAGVETPDKNKNILLDGIKVIKDIDKRIFGEILETVAVVPIDSIFILFQVDPMTKRPKKSSSSMLPPTIDSCGRCSSLCSVLLLCYLSL